MGRATCDAPLTSMYTIPGFTMAPANRRVVYSCSSVRLKVSRQTVVKVNGKAEEGEGPRREARLMCLSHASQPAPWAGVA